MTTELSTVGLNLKIWQTLQRVPFGPWLFAKGLGFKAPYFRTIRPTVVALEPGLCRVEAPNRWRVHNHLGTFHAIAACNMAELAAGLMTDATVPNSHRWIPKAMTVEYRTKATTDLVAVASLDSIPVFADSPSQLIVPVTILDTNRVIVVAAEITMHISPKRS
ncbi:DUF4442 domain-containing protein [Rhodococcus sp. 14-2496-1d]|uniref:hotdog fold domain-containing protein n=1 Tax=Rhodococcus sp. 14-2496-1d TaxID=2023146 RepID=UPI000B9B6D08|nr:hotdog fold domain-containing protein [Rhodococcus sp. 14-2496-1d]OZF25664.1 DUF4442 domain-containing protein [Rhodococcus sp. 14-2496-1d]